MDISGALETKYSILQQQADAAKTNAAANASLAAARVKTEIPAQAGLMGAQGAYYGAEAQTLPGFRNALSGYYQGMGAAEQAQAGLLGANTQQTLHGLGPGNEDNYWIAQSMRPGFTAGQQRLGGDNGSSDGVTTTPVGTPRSVMDNGSYPSQSQGVTSIGTGAVSKYAKGTAKVPGKGKPNKDTVPAMLAPGEAVLNQGAADHVGRNLIDVLNAIGAHKMAQQGNPPPGPGGAPVPAAGGMPQGR
ncbi:hypothetical protein [Silvimonas sp.]|uniref:hypothetical protein n=1 Tax=Silvimonas sp. TaxID=2650811 RepID=UPI002850F5E9|nr:hypothetical protein [Silvimonas sp.]MDR3427799.1 hypothetical protein [Silvimonas sp.]